MTDSSNAEPIVVMVGTAIETMGGISTVVKGYRAAGLFDRTDIAYVTTHCDGTAGKKLQAAARGYTECVRMLLTGSVRLVHIHLSSRASFWRKLPIVLFAKLLRKPVILHLHGSEFMTFYRSECGALRKHIVRFAFDRADAIIALSPQWRQNVQEITRNPNVEVVFNGVAVPNGPPEPPDGGQGSQILFLGRLGWRKGIYDLLAALARVRSRGIPFRLVAAGDGETSEAAEKARELGLESAVDILGWVDDRGKIVLLRESSIFVLPSHAEGLPMSLLEAMAYGLPVVCTSVGGIPTAVTHESDGLLVPPGDVEALAEALARLLTDRELRSRCGRNAHDRAKREFDVQRSVDRLLSLYERYGVH